MMVLGLRLCVVGKGWDGVMVGDLLGWEGLCRCRRGVWMCILESEGIQIRVEVILGRKAYISSSISFWFDYFLNKCVVYVYLY